MYLDKLGSSRLKMFVEYIVLLLVKMYLVRCEFKRYQHEILDPLEQRKIYLISHCKTTDPK